MRNKNKKSERVRIGEWLLVNILVWLFVAIIGSETVYAITLGNAEADAVMARQAEKRRIEALRVLPTEMREIPIEEEKTAPTAKNDTIPATWADGRDREMAVIAEVAKEMNFSNVKALWRLAHCESRFDNTRTNKNTDTRATTDRGIFQFNDYWHPEVDEACARDTKCATKRTIELTRHADTAQEIQWSCRGVWFDENYNYLLP